MTRATDAPQAIMLRHMEQLAPVVSRWKDTIHALQAGIVGAWGEWHGESYAIDKTAVLNKIVGTLLPPGTYLQMRLPDYKNLLPSSHPAYSRIGIHNDAWFLGKPQQGLRHRRSDAAAPSGTSWSPRPRTRRRTGSSITARGTRPTTSTATATRRSGSFLSIASPPSATTMVIGTREGRPRRRWDGGKISR